MDIDLRKLRFVVEVAKVGSLSAAAEVLGVTQPALSRTIALMEDRYGFKLFDRGPRGTRPTQAGMQVIREADRILRASAKLDWDMRRHGSGSLGMVRFGMGPMLASLGLATITNDILAQSGKVQVRCSIKPFDELIRELHAEKIDFAVTPGRAVRADSSIIISDIGKISYGYFVRSDHPLARAGDISPADLIKFPYAAASEIKHPDAYHFQHGIICDNYNILMDILLAGECICVTSPVLVGSYLQQGLVTGLNVNQVDTLDDYIALLVNRDRTLSPATKITIEAFKRFFGQI